MARFLKFLGRLCSNIPVAVAVFVLLLTLIIAFSASIVFPEGPWMMVAKPFIPPGVDMNHPLGTDMLGRDLAAGIFHGSRVSLLIGTTSTLSAVVVGLIVGSLAGYYGGLIDNILSRVIDLFQTIPPFVFAVVFVSIFEPSIFVIVIAIALISWPTIARLSRGEFISLRDREFVQASVAIGMSPLRIIATQILPNSLSPIIVTASVTVAYAILIESALAFLGLGDPNVMSWGSMIGAGRDMLRNATYMTAVPGIAIVLVVLSLTIVGEGLNDALNPRNKGRST